MLSIGELAARTGASARDISGKFEVIRRSPDTHFSFPITSADLLGLGQLDIVSIVSDKGEVEWSLVKDASAPVQAKHIGSLKDFETAARDAGKGSIRIQSGPSSTVTPTLRNSRVGAAIRSHSLTRSVARPVSRVGRARNGASIINVGATSGMLDMSTSPSNAVSSR